MEKIILNFNELQELWNEDTPSWEFSEWFLDNAPSLPNSSAVKQSYLNQLNECYGDDIDENAPWVQAAWHAHLAVIVWAYNHYYAADKEYIVVPKHDYITWHGRLSHDFTLEELEA